MTEIWGFDLGVTSVGVAVVRRQANGEGEIRRLGVRIFPESREASKKGYAPKNAARRQARLARRQLRRRRWRRVELRRLLSEAGLLQGPRDQPPRNPSHDPYALRARGLSEPLAPHELGWALFHLLKRRGFQGSRKRAEEPNAKDQTAKKAAEEEQETASRGEQLRLTLGDRKLASYLVTIASSVEHPERRRGVGQTRAMVTDELDALWAEQTKAHPEILTPELRGKIESVALFQRPTYFRARTFGQCDLEPGEPRALKAEWLTQHFEMLQLVNALRLEGGNQRRLDEAERAAALAYLDSTPKPTWADLRKTLGFTARSDRFTHERGKKETVRGNATEVALRNALGPGFPAHPHADSIRAAIGQAWHGLEYRTVRDGAILEIRDAAAIAAQRTEFATRARADWGLSAEDATALSAIDLPDGTARQSLMAMRRMLPGLEAGDPYMTVRDRAYAVRESGAPLPRLPGPNPSEITRDKIPDDFARRQMEKLLAGIHNPTVLRTLGELQKVVNTLLRVYPRPDLIRLEYARDLKHSAKDRLEEDSRQQKREKARGKAREKLASLGKPSAGPEGEENVLRYLLWQEQGGRSPYSGETIACADALNPEATEIDHLFPVSRSFDDSQANKVLCFRSENREKGNRTPYEWLNPQPDRWSHLTGTVWKQMEKAGWPEAKRRRCQKPALEQAGDEAFTNRQLVDTAFIARAARDYLGLLFGGGQEGVTRVQTVSGRATALLRRAWGIGLGRLLHGEVEAGVKSRDDHRHHAVDALTVALTGPAEVRALSAWWQRREAEGIRPPAFPLPWPDLREHARAALAAIVVSHRVQAKWSGALHDAQPLGLICDSHTQGHPTFVTRKPLRAGAGGLSDGEIEKIIDPKVRATIKQAVAEAGGKLEHAFAKEIRLPRNNGQPGPVIRSVRVKGAKQDPSAYDHVHEGAGRKSYKTNQALHHLEIVDTGTKIESIFVLKNAFTTSNNARRAERSENPSLLFSLCRGDAIARTTDAGIMAVYIVRDFYRSGQIFIEPHHYAGTAMRSGSKKPNTLIKEGWSKVSVDPIGRVRPAK